MGERALVLLLHGMWMGPWAMAYLAHELRNAGFQTRYLALQSLSDTPEAHVERLSEEISRIAAPRIHLLGHSMGGVIVLRYLKECKDKRIRRALLLGAPVLGSEAARQLDQGPWGGSLGASRKLWRSQFQTKVPGGLEVGAIAGERALGLGQFFTSLDGPNDGAVTVAETRIAGLRDHIVLPVSHSTMLISALVAKNAIAYLQSGAFLR